MKLIQFAISSIVDANTQYIFSDHNPSQFAVAQQHGRAIRSRSVLASLKALRTRIAAAIGAFRAGVAERREIDKLLQLKDYLLKDIGFEREDLLAAKHGLVSLAELEIKRRKSAYPVESRLHRPAKAQSSDAAAANQAVYAVSQCA